MDREIIDKIRKKTDIVELISRYVSLKSSGSSYKGVCPFHEDNDPSLTVDPTKKLWHCFGCGAGGDVFNFLMKIENLSFPEAARQLARETGVKIPSDQRSSKEPDLTEIMNAASEYYHKNLSRRGPGKKARNYLESRGYGKKVIEGFNLGYSLPNWNSLTNKFKQEYSLSQLEKAGLANKSDKGKYYDRFRNRLMIPIKSPRGKVVAFGGRILDPDDEPKYLNSPNTPLFKKGQVLFAIPEARRAMGKADRAILVEGYTDVIAPHSRGLKNVIASMGTALTNAQANLLARYVSEVVIAYDRDQAGQQATLKGLKLLRNAGLSVKIANLPPDSDPADLIEKGGRKRFEKAIEDLSPFHQFYIEVLTEKFDLSTVSGRERALIESTNFLSGIESPPLRHELVNQLKDLLKVSETEIENRVKYPQKQIDSPSGLRVERSQEDLSLDEWVIYFLLEGMISHEKLEEEGVLEQIDPQLQTLANKLIEGTNDGLTTEEIVNKMGEKERKKFSQISLLDVRFEKKSTEKAVHDLIKKFKQKKIAELKNELRAGLTKEKDEEEIQLLQKEIAAAQKELQQFR